MKSHCYRFVQKVLPPTKGLYAVFNLTLKIASPLSEKPTSPSKSLQPQAY